MICSYLGAGHLDGGTIAMFRLGVGYGCIVGRLVFPWYRPAWLLPGILFLPLVLSVGPARAEGEIILHFKDFADMLAKAEAGDRDAETAVGLAYLKGKDVAADPAKAVRFLTAAAEHGSAP